MRDKDRDIAIQQGQKDGGPQQPNQRAQGELGEQQHQGGGVAPERRQPGGANEVDFREVDPMSDSEDRQLEEANSAITNAVTDFLSEIDRMMGQWDWRGPHVHHRGRADGPVIRTGGPG